MTPSNKTTASEEFDITPGEGVADEAHYCKKHDLFKVKNSVGNFVCVACKVVAGMNHADGSTEWFS